MKLRDFVFFKKHPISMKASLKSTIFGRSEAIGKSAPPREESVCRDPEHILG